MASGGSSFFRGKGGVPPVLTAGSILGQARDSARFVVRPASLFLAYHGNEDALLAYHGNEDARFSPCTLALCD